jgi:hypothetical protein
LPQVTSAAEAHELDESAPGQGLHWLHGDAFFRATTVKHLAEWIVRQISDPQTRYFLEKSQTTLDQELDNHQWHLRALFLRWRPSPNYLEFGFSDYPNQTEGRL